MSTEIQEIQSEAAHFRKVCEEGREHLVSERTIALAVIAAADVLSDTDLPLSDEARRGALSVMRRLRRAVIDARQEWAGTKRAAELTGWNPDTLRKYGKLVVEGGAIRGEWATLSARRDGNDFSFMIPTIPLNPNVTLAGELPALRKAS